MYQQPYFDPLVGKTFFIRAKHSGLYLDAAGEGKSNGTKIIQYTLNKQTNQQWTFEADGYIRNKGNGLVIDISGASGHQIICYQANGGMNQKWKYNGKNIVSQMNGKVLDVSGASKANGGEVIVYASNGGLNQEWELIDPQTMQVFVNYAPQVPQQAYAYPPQGYAYPPQYAPQGYGLPPPNPSVAVLNQTFYIRSKSNGLFLDASGAGKSNGTKIIVYTLNRQLNQQWTFDAEGFIRNKNSGLVIDISGGKGDHIICYQANGGMNQKWKWDGKHISSQMNGKVLDVSGNSNKPGAEVIVYQANNQLNQEWELVPINQI